MLELFDLICYLSDNTVVICAAADMNALSSVGR